MRRVCWSRSASPSPRRSCAEPMGKRWGIYAAVVCACTVLFWAYRQWLALLIWAGVLCLPAAGLLFSLRGMLTARVSGKAPAAAVMGGEVTVDYGICCKTVAPPCRWRLRVTNLLTGESRRLKPGEKLPTQHCGQLKCQTAGSRVYDYLGLVWHKLPPSELTVTVRPAPLPISHVPGLEQCLAIAWKPKPGGGFSENHELRPYRPGDPLNQIHWKLTAKTGSYIIREPMLPVNRRLLLEIEVRGTPEELDRKFGRLLWLGQLLERDGLACEIRALSGAGVECLPVYDAESLNAAVDTLLGRQAAPPEAGFPAIPAAWCYRVGGDAS